MIEKITMLQTTPKTISLPPRPSKEELIIDAGHELDNRYQAATKSNWLEANPDGHRAITRMQEAARIASISEVSLAHSRLRSSTNESLNLALDLFISESALASMNKATESITGLSRLLNITTPEKQWTPARKAILGFLDTHDTRHNFALIYGYTSLAFDEASSERVKESIAVVQEVLYSSKNIARTPVIRLLESEAAKYASAASPADLKILLSGTGGVQGTPRDVIAALRFCPDSLEFCTNKTFSDICASTATHLNVCNALLQRGNR